MLGWSLVPLRWSEGCHWHLGNITHKQWIKHLAFAFVPFVHTLQTPRLRYNLWIPPCREFCSWYDRKCYGKKKSTPPKQMYRILNRATERPQMDWKTLHMWFVNMIYTSVSLSSLLLAAPGWGGACGAALDRQLSVQGMSAALLTYPDQDDYSWLQWLFCCNSPTVLSRQWQRKGWWREGWVWFTAFALEKERHGWTCKFPCCLYWICDDIQETYVKPSPASKIDDVWPCNLFLCQSLCIYLYK